MTSRKPPKQRNADYALQQHGRQLQSMSPGSPRPFAGAAPVLPTEHMAAFVTDPAGAGGSGISFSNKPDIFTLAADGPQDLELTFWPLDESVHVALNGIDALPETDWTIDRQTLSLLTPLDARTDDVVSVKYAYLDNVPVVPGEPVDFGSDYANAVMLDTPLAYWRCDDAGSALVDVTSGNHDASGYTGTSVRGVASLLPSDMNLATSITSHPGYFTIPASTAFNTSAFSFEFWTDHGASGSFAVWQNNDRLRIVLAGGTGEVLVGSGTATSIAITDTSYTAGVGGKHLVVTYDGTTVKFYRDGLLYGSPFTYSHSLASVSTPVYLGVADGNDVHKIDEVAMYDYVLTAAQVATHWAAA